MCTVQDQEFSSRAIGIKGLVLSLQMEALKPEI